MPIRAKGCPLAGLVFNSDGHAMKASFSYGRRGKLYRYYVSPPSAFESGEPGVRRVPAAALERLVRGLVGDLLGRGRRLNWAEICETVRRVELHVRSIHVVVEARNFADPYEPLAPLIDQLRQLTTERLVAERRRGVRAILDRAPIVRGGVADADRSAEVGRPDAKAVSILKAAHKLLVEHCMSPMSPDTHADGRAPSYQRARRMSVGLWRRRFRKRYCSASGGSKSMIS